MSEIITFTIDDVEVEGHPGQTIMQVADEADIYIPRLCAHKDLPAGKLFTVGTQNFAALGENGLQEPQLGQLDLPYIVPTTAARKLKGAGYVKSMRGPYGGYMLAKPTKEISVGDIVKVLEGTDSIIDCTESDNVCGVCNRAGECLTRWIWEETSAAMFKKLDSFKINKLIEDPDQVLKKRA